MGNILHTYLLVPAPRAASPPVRFQPQLFSVSRGQASTLAVLIMCLVRAKVRGEDSARRAVLLNPNLLILYAVFDVIGLSDFVTNRIISECLCLWQMPGTFPWAPSVATTGVTLGRQ